MKAQSSTNVTISKEFFDFQINQLQKEKYSLEKQVYDLTTKLNYERELRKKAESELKFFKDNEEKKSRKRRTKQEMDLIRSQNIEYNPKKSNNVNKPTCADYIPSYTYYKKIILAMEENIKSSTKRYLINHIRNKALFIVGLSFGVRVGDLLELRWKNLFEDDELKNYKIKVTIIEDKTNKLNSLLITESVKKAIDEYKGYLIENNIKFETKDYIFSNFQNGKHISKTVIYDYLSQIQKEKNLPFHLSTHSLRKTFINVAACVDSSSIDQSVLTKCQVLLNHNDATTTMRYMGALNTICNMAREKVSDWLLGKTNIDVLGVVDKKDELLIEKLKEMLQ